MLYFTFIDDLICRIAEYNNSFKNEAEESRYPLKQRQRWAPVERRKAITQKTIGYDDENCLLLLAELGYDGKPVSSQTSSTVRKWFETTNGHIFPPENDVLRLAIFFNLDFYQTLHLLLKAKFEEYLLDHDERWEYLCGDSYLDILTSYNEENRRDELEEAVNIFRRSLKSEQLYFAFENLWGMASSAGYSRENFKTLLDTFFLENLLYSPNDSKKVQNFSEYQQMLIDQARFGTQEEQDSLWRKRCIWQMLLDNLDEIYIEIENTRLKSAETEQEYLKLFGLDIIRQTELEAEIYLLEMQVSLRRINPDITEDELEKKILEKQEELQNQLHELKLKEAYSQETTLMEAWQQMGVPMEKGKLDEEKELCKKEIRAIRKLVHPDILMNNPEYQNLSQEQKDELEEILLDSLKISFSELGYPPNFAYHDMRSLDGLRQVRRRVETILKMTHIQVDLQYQIEGENISEQIQWLEKEILYIENQINAAKGQLTAMLTNSEIQAMKVLLRDESKQKLFSEQMTLKIEELQVRKDNLTAELETLIKEK